MFSEGAALAKQSFDITGMTCAACSARVEKAASGVEGVDAAVVNLLKNSMELTYNGDAAVIGAVCSAVEKAGYGAVPRGVDPLLCAGAEHHSAGGHFVLHLPDAQLHH